MTIKTKLVAKQDGHYTVFVFEDLNQEPTSTTKYITCVKVPNWNYNHTIEIDDIGYLEYKSVKAGENYFNAKTEDHGIYKYTNCYFINFIKEREVIKNKEFKF